MKLNRNNYDIGIKLRARALMTLPDSTSQKFILLGQVAKRDQTNNIGRVVIVYLDFSKTRTRKCGEADFEKWYARPAKTECLMGHKVRGSSATIIEFLLMTVGCSNGINGERLMRTVTWGRSTKILLNTKRIAIVQKRTMSGAFFAWCYIVWLRIYVSSDYNFIRNGKDCVPVGPEPIPAGVCTGNPEQTYKGSSGFRKIPGNTCKGGVVKDELVDKKCSQGKLPAFS